MRHTTLTTTAATLLAVLLAAGCSGGGDDAKAAPKASASSSPATATQGEDTASATAAPAPKLSKKWGPKLQAAGGTNVADICKQVGSKACVTHITKMTEVVFDVDTAIDEAEAQDVYAKTKAEIAEIEDASSGYADGGCAGSTEATLGGSECGGYVAKLLLGPATVDMTMTTDELTAG